MATTTTCIEPMPDGGFCTVCEKYHPKHDPMRLQERDVQMMLIYFQTSANAHQWINFAWHDGKIKDLIPAERAELVSSMRLMADRIEALAGEGEG